MINYNYNRKNKIKWTILLKIFKKIINQLIKKYLIQKGTTKVNLSL